MPMVLEPTSSPRSRPPEGLAVRSVDLSLGDDGLADRELTDEFLAFESTPALYARHQSALGSFKSTHTRPQNIPHKF
jgi:hypothetical protein